MARIFTTPAAEAAAKAWMHDVMVIAGVVQSQRTSSEIYFNYYHNVPTADAKKICDELINRDFTNIDSSINMLSSYKFFPSFTSSGHTKSFKPDVIAKAIVYMAECFNLYWDDTIRTPYEVEEFKKTILGDAVYKYGRYISTIKDKATSRKAASNVSGGPRVAASAPQNGYKSSGPQSGNVRGLLGNPGDKVYADGPVSYRIEGDKVKSNTPKVFIKPLNTSGEVNGTNKIFISSGNGYTDCVCYFDDPNDAQNFLNKIEAAGRVPVDVSNLHVAKVKSDTNGYFLVSTEFGTCAISARTLNEAITEALADVPTGKTGWEKATERYTKEELDELHAWMRRD